jgi:hypothetical protein
VSGVKKDSGKVVWHAYERILNGACIHPERGQNVLESVHDVGQNKMRVASSDSFIINELGLVLGRVVRIFIRFTSFDPMPYTAKTLGCADCMT